MLHFFRIPGSQSEHKILQLTQGKIPSIVSVQSESCFNAEVINGGLSEIDRDKLLWLFTETYVKVFTNKQVEEQTSELFLLTREEKKENAGDV